MLSPLPTLTRTHPSVFIVLTARRGSALHVMFRFPCYARVFIYDRQRQTEKLVAIPWNLPIVE